jgi:hypothetical protein
LDLQKKETTGVQTEDHRRTERRLARGLEDVSHLFLTQPPNRPTEKAEEQTAFAVQTSQEVVRPATPIPLHSSPAVNRELLISLLHDKTDVLEEGLKAIDTNVSCAPFGSIDLVAVDSFKRLSVIGVDTLQSDVSLLQGIAHVDWLVRNTPVVRRMYKDHAIDFSIPPRLFLVAPHFSPLFQCVAQRLFSPRISCFEYRTAGMPAGLGILFELA